MLCYDKMNFMRFGLVKAPTAAHLAIADDRIHTYRESTIILANKGSSKVFYRLPFNLFPLLTFIFRE